MLKLQLVLLCTLCFSVWLFAGLAPAREWHAEMRVFVPQIFFMGPYFLYWALMLARFTSANEFYTNEMPRFIMVSAAVVLAMAAWGLFHVKLMHETWGGFMAATPCGASSCSADTSSTATYNPNGFFKTQAGQRYTDYMPTTCMYQDCIWGPGRAQQAIPRTLGYPPLAGAPGYPDFAAGPCTSIQTDAGECLATNRTQDYPDPGLGIPGGFLSGFGVRVPSAATPGAVCPGVQVLPSGQRQGLAACAYCTPYYKKHYAAYTQELAPFKHCPSVFAEDAGTPRADNHVWCGIVLGTFSYCPQPYETRTPHVMRRIVMYWYMVTTVPVLPVAFFLARPFAREDKPKLS